MSLALSVRALVHCDRSSAGLELLIGAPKGFPQIPDSRRDLTIPAERLNNQNLRHTVLVQCQASFASLATEWRLTVGQPFKAGIWCRGLKPSATISRHSVTNTKVNLAELR